MRRVENISYDLVIQYNRSSISGLIELIYNLYTIIDIDNDLIVMDYNDLVNYIESRYHCNKNGSCINLNMNMFMCNYCVINIVNDGIKNKEIILYNKN